MDRERLNEKKASRNGRQGNTGWALQTPVFCRPACRQHSYSGRRGSQIIEYALVIAAISAAFATMFVYGKRGLQGVIRSTITRDFYPQTQADGSPAAGFMGNESMQSHFDTLSGDSSRAQLGATGITYDTDTYSSSTGVVTMHQTGN